MSQQYNIVCKKMIKIVNLALYCRCYVKTHPIYQQQNMFSSAGNYCRRIVWRKGIDIWNQYGPELQLAISDISLATVNFDFLLRASLKLKAMDTDF